MNTNLEWVILVTNKYPKSREFYAKVLNLPIVRESSDEEFTQFRLANCYLAIYGRKGIKKLIGARLITKSGGAIYTFGETKDIDKTYYELKNKGVSFFKEPVTQPWGQRTAYFTDPDGHIWEIQQWLKK